MSAKRVRSFGDMLDAPEGVWFEMPDGVDIVELDATTDPPTRRVHLRLPPEVARDLEPGPGDRLTARIRRGTLTLEKTAKARRPRKEMR